MKEGTIAEKMQLLNQSDDMFYRKPWFWICLTLIVMCLTRPHVKVTSGNDNSKSWSKN